MSQTPAELSEGTRRRHDAPKRALVPEAKRELASTAMTLSELEERIEHDRFARFIAQSNVERFERILAGSLDDDLRRRIEILLEEERAKLAAAPTGP